MDRKSLNISKVNLVSYPRDRVSVKDYKKYFEAVSKKVMGDKAYESNDVIKTVLNYFYGVKQFDKYDCVLNEPSLDKGLYIFGPYGTGKSAMMNIMHLMGKELILNHGNHSMWFPQRTAPWFTDQYMKKANDRQGLSNFNLEDYYKGRLYIDDVGMEGLAFKDTDVVGKLLFHRHRNEVKTFMTSNLTPKEFGERYGGRLADRLPQMCNIIKMDGESFREG